MSPSRTKPVVSNETPHQNETFTGKRYGIIIRTPVQPAAACDRTDISCTAYGFRIHPVTEGDPLMEHRTILSSCEFDDREI